MVNIAFITLIERKVLRYSQRRVGPNKSSYIGLLQPGADAVKLFSKSLVRPEGRFKALFLLAPLGALFLMLWVWGIIPKRFERRYFYYSRVFLLIVLSLNVYPLLLRGWSSANKYSMIGALRRVAQTISYEVSLAVILLGMLLYSLNLRLDLILDNKNYFVLSFVLPMLIRFWLISRLAETNRTPFDFSEGERELVSGFNTEYSAGAFAVIFMAEYGRIYFLRFLRAFIFVFPRSVLWTALAARLIVFFWIWARRTFPRYRYDLLINLAWKRILPLALALTIFISRLGLY